MAIAVKGELVDHRTPVFLCWYCSKQLPSAFTSVVKDGVARRVHYGCRAPAAVLVHEEPGTFPPAFRSEGADWVVGKARARA